MKKISPKLDLTREDQFKQFDLKKTIMGILILWPWLILSAAICVGIAILYIRQAPPAFKAVSSLMIKDEKKGAELMDNSALKQIGLGGNSKLLENEIEVLRSYDLMETVVRKLQLFVNIKRTEKFRDVDEFGPELPFSLIVMNPEVLKVPLKWTLTETAEGGLLQTNDKEPVRIRAGQQVNVGELKMLFTRTMSDSGKFNAANAQEYTINLNSIENVTIAYTKRLAVDPASKLATVINIELQDNNERRAVTILDSLVKIYNRQGLDDKNKVTNNTVEFLANRLASVQQGLQQTEKSVERYKSENRITDLSADAQQFLTSSTEIDLKKAQSQTQLNIINSLEQDLESDTNPKLVPSTLGIMEPSLGILISKHNELVLQQERLLQTTGPKNPLLIDVQQQVKEIRASLLSNVKTLKRSFTISYNDLAAKDAQLNQRIRYVPQIEQKLVDITRDHTVQSELYAFLLQKKEEAEIARASNIDDSRTIIRPRSIGDVAVSRKLILAFGLLIGLALPIGIAALKDVLNTRIDNKKEIEESSAFPIIGAISHVKKSSPGLEVMMKSRTVVSEQVRNIRTELGFTKKGVKTVMITSHQPGDGKSFVSLNIAASLAMLDKKTVLLEFDLRRPKLKERLDMKGNIGLSSFLVGNVVLDDIISEVPDSGGKLFMISSGHLPPNPAELISGTNTNLLFEQLRARFDYIVVDTPPYQVVTDAAILQEHADLTLFVIREGHTNKSVFKTLSHISETRPDKPVYLIVNDAGKNKKNQAEYGYQYGKNYYSSDVQEKS